MAESFNFIKDWEEEEKAYYIKKMISYLDLKKKIEPSTDKKKEKFNDTKLWLFLGKKYRGRVRSSCLMFICKFLQNVAKDIAEKHIAEITPLIFDMISEDNSIV